MMKKTMLCAALALMICGCQTSGDEMLFRDFDNNDTEGYVAPEEVTVKPQPLPPLTEAPLFENSVRSMDFSEIDVIPQVYAIAATRATNKMLDETQGLYLKKEKKPTLNIVAPQKLNDELPDGFHYAHKVTNAIIEGSRNYTIVDNLNDADYSLQVLVNALPNPGSVTPVIEYQLLMSDKDGKEVGQWVESIKQIKNDDKSWW